MKILPHKYRAALETSLLRMVDQSIPKGSQPSSQVVEAKHEVARQLTNPHPNISPSPTSQLNFTTQRRRCVTYLAKVVASEEPTRRTSEGLEINRNPPKVRGAQRPLRQATKNSQLSIAFPIKLPYPITVVACWLAAVAGQGFLATLQFRPHVGDIYPYVSHVRVTVNDEFWIEGTYLYTLRVADIVAGGVHMERFALPTSITSGQVNEPDWWIKDKEIAGGKIVPWRGDGPIADIETWRQNFSISKPRTEQFYVSNIGSLYSENGAWVTIPSDMGSVFNLVYPSHKQFRVGLEPWLYRFNIPSGPIMVKYNLNAISNRYATITAEIQPCKAAETLEPYKYFIDLKTGRPVTSSGCVRMFLGDNHVDIRFSESMENWVMKLMLNRT